MSLWGSSLEAWRLGFWATLQLSGSTAGDAAGAGQRLQGAESPSRGREKGERQQGLCVCTCVCLCVCIRVEEMGKEKGLPAHTLRAGKAEGRGEAGGGGYRGSPRVLGASGGHGGPSPPRVPSQKQVTFSGGTVLITDHSSCAPAGAPSTGETRLG